MLVRQCIEEVSPRPGRHLLVHADSAKLRFLPPAGLVLTCPPFFHPRGRSKHHGLSPPIRRLEDFAVWVAKVLERAAGSLRPGGLVCFVKTDVRYKGALLPVGFRIAEAVMRQGAVLRAHWVWQRIRSYSPYAPTIGNVFVFGDAVSPRLRSSGLFFDESLQLQRGEPTSWTPGLFEVLIRQLSAPGDTIVDPFAGRGSIIQAAAKSGRWGAGVEMSAVQLRRAKRLLAHIPNLEIHTQ